MELKNIVLWGTGIIGKKYYSMLQKLGKKPVMFVDNNIEKQGKFMDDIPIYPPDILKNANDYTVLIACKANDDIYKQALELGISENKIFSVYDTSYILMSYLIDCDAWNIGEIRNKERKENSIAIDLQNGAALGGVETWALEQGEKLRTAGKKVTFMLGNPENNQLVIPAYFESVNISIEKDLEQQVMENVTFLISRQCDVVISNFVGNIFIAYCYYKRLHEKVKHIMVIHNDELPYFKAAIAMQEYIDFCIVISTRIKEKLLSCGFPEKKIVVLNWNISVSDDYRLVTKNEKLRIGYAGRVTKKQKRLDFLPKIIDKLNQEKIVYIFELAGVGDYYDELEEYICSNDLKDRVVLLGMLEKSKMRDFWRGQDIYLSCSDWEGHSISQCEGIASGAVPVVTDVSGAGDDIEDGVTGYIVSVGDWEALADRIVYLDQHRDILKRMSDAGMDKMRERNRLFRDNVLEELCR
ncbi:MAG: glycosyltransferase [Lachnospiraceae bacterium]|nr:glycosyltransferase [Lachnospiraceae bacterium]